MGPEGPGPPLGIDVPANSTLRDAEGHLMNFAEIASIEVDKEIVAVGAGPE